MSIRPVEMQGSIPQSQNASKIQDQIQQRGQVGQEIISEHLKQEELKKRRQVNETNDSEKTRLQSEDKEKNQQHEQNNQKQDRKRKETQADHPYKGKFVDFSG
ncbi:hypothetical protein [Bacillus solitudinis]|uniref:hypothetical protein n=1 Tax=Bacillus solitudinis TaxID=2014074 RepID=UPI000C239437|nr:hypothetical protein [Bacillus solitudinis]